MGTRSFEVIIDDLDGTNLGTNSGESVRFSLDGKDYSIDLSADNAAKLREALAPYISAGRRVRAGSTGKTRSVRSARVA